ncbi:MFS transporter [Paenibacillus dakarensis]|uniref:MFS transporter n=1 Tax=Paenibacillus dakarensis TaxID=1527293 RepID=UPI0006D57BCF|nr:MFS transporter [Paenibacillus dakarensis]
MDIFRNRNFSIMFSGRILTNIGDSLYAVAAMWLVYDLGGSTLFTGLAGFLSIIPRIIQIFSGPLIDRLPVRGILVFTQLFQGVVLLIVPIAYYFDFLTVGLVLTITPILSTCNMWVYPAQLSALPKILDKKLLTQGNSLFSIAYQGIDVACNAISGVLIVAIGAVSLYFWNAIGFFIGALLFTQIRMPSRTADINKDGHTNLSQNSTASAIRDFKTRYLSDMKDGIRTLVATPLSRLLFGIIMVNAAGGATFTVLPAFSDSMGGAGIYGLLLMAQALGSLVGAVAAPYLKLERISLGALYSGAFMICGIAWGVCVFIPWPWLTILVYGLSWVPGGITNVIINTVIQKGVPAKNLGSVFAAATGLSGIASPAGSLIGGALGLWIGGNGVILWCGIAIFLVSVYWRLDPVSRRLPASDQVDETVFGYGTTVENTASSVI